VLRYTYNACLVLSYSFTNKRQSVLYTGGYRAALKWTVIYWSARLGRKSRRLFSSENARAHVYSTYLRWSGSRLRKDDGQDQGTSIGIGWRGGTSPPCLLQSDHVEMCNYMIKVSWQFTYLRTCGSKENKNKMKIMGLGDRQQRFTERRGGGGNSKFAALKVYRQCPGVLLAEVGWRQLKLLEVTVRRW
jgi:hypothetical protein